MTTPAHPQKGDIIAGKYQVEDVLGAGGMGVVVAARHMVLRQRVAVKFLLANATRIPDSVERFLREARASVAIQSEHVARVLDVGTLENGAPYMVMEYLAGTDFSKVLKQRGALPIDEALDFVLQASEAIAEAHTLGIVHRDLKPGNLFLTTRAEGSPLVKVLDFGLSKMAAHEGDAPESSLTATGFVAGSPQYMSPEQVRSLRNVDWRTDIWALGVILYESITARRPFEGPSLTAVCASIVADEPVPMREVRGEIPAGLEAAVMRCLEKDPRRRMRTVAELAEALAPFAPARSQGSVEHIMRLLPDTGTVPLQMAAPVAVPASTPRAIPHEATTPPTHEAPPMASSQASVVVVEAPTTGHRGAWGQTRPVAQRARPGLIAGIAAAVTAMLAAVAIVATALVWTRRSPARVDATPGAASAPLAMATASASTIVETPAAEPTASASAVTRAIAAPTPPTPLPVKTAAPAPRPPASPPPPAPPLKPKTPPKGPPNLERSD